MFRARCSGDLAAGLNTSSFLGVFRVSSTTADKQVRKQLTRSETAVKIDEVITGVCATLDNTKTR